MAATGEEDKVTKGQGDRGRRNILLIVAEGYLSPKV
jgi:hypothetical protein